MPQVQVIEPSSHPGQGERQIFILGAGERRYHIIPCQLPSAFVLEFEKLSTRIAACARTTVATASAPRTNREMEGAIASEDGFLQLARGVQVGEVEKDLPGDPGPSQLFIRQEFLERASPASWKRQTINSSSTTLNSRARKFFFTPRPHRSVCVPRVQST